MNLVVSTPQSGNIFLSRDDEQKEIDRLFAQHDLSSRSQSFRKALLAHFKERIKQGHEWAHERLLEDGKGRICTQRLCLLQDDIIKLLFYTARTYLYRLENPSTSEKLSIIATGGYGRGGLAPGSDVDLLFLHPYKQTPWGESVVEFILYFLWDLGLKVGHATRTVDDCIRLSRNDMTIRTSILEMRLIDGDKGLFEELEKRFDGEVVASTGREFIAAKLKERDNRHLKNGNSRYLLEPNIKEGKGGLRDLHTLYWIAKYFYRVRSTRELISKGILSRAEYDRFRKCEDFFWTVRCHIHFITKRPDERLTFDLQRELARRFGYTDRPGQSAVERFMKHYFLNAKTVGNLTRIICAALEEEEAKQRPIFNRFFNPFRYRRVALETTPDFALENNRLTVAQEDVFERDPVNLVRIFATSHANDYLLHPDAVALIARSLQLIRPEIRDNEEANALFLQILTTKKSPEVILRKMNETGVLGKFIPEFGKVVGMMQFNMYHHYTVDEHLIRSVGVLSDIESGRIVEDHPLSATLIPKVKDRKLLYVTLLLHDIAKGRDEDHSIAGARVARKLCRRFGLSEAQTETVAWLIENHLVMSSIAQSRDLSDHRTITDFATIVQSLERLRLLLILTVCDIRAVGPDVWTGWKGQLLRTLYWETEPHLTGGHSAEPRSHRVNAAKAALSEALPDWSPDQLEAYVERQHPAYFLKTSPEEQVRHARLIEKASSENSVIATHIVPLEFEGVTGLTIYTADHPNLLSLIAGACSLQGGNIVEAQISTTTDGWAIDTIWLARTFDSDEDEFRRADTIAQLLEKVLRGEESLPEKTARLRKKQRVPKAFRVPTEVVFDNNLSDKYTVLEVSGKDRQGLLYDLTRAINGLNLYIGSARVATFGARVVDAFYVTDLTGGKIKNHNRRQKIIRQLSAVFDGNEKPAQKRQNVAAE